MTNPGMGLPLATALATLPFPDFLCKEACLGRVNCTETFEPECCLCENFARYHHSVKDQLQFQVDKDATMMETPETCDIRDGLAAILAAMASQTTNKAGRARSTRKLSD